MGDSDDSKPRYRPLDYLDHGLLSPSGKVSKRSRKLAQDRLSRQLWPDGCTREDITGSSESTEEDIKANEIERLLRQAKTLRDLANKGMYPRKYKKEANRLEALAAELGTETKE